jgi:hypothetical protein
VPHGYISSLHRVAFGDDGCSNGGGWNHNLNLVPKENSYSIEVETRFLGRRSQRAYTMRGVTVGSRPIRLKETLS